MPDTPQLLMFIAAGWLLNLTPGPDVLYIVSNALKSGVRAGIVAALGIVSGCFVHVFAAALGVSALLATSATAFTVLKWIGAAYLMWMGVRMLLSKPGADNGNTAALAAAQAAPVQHTPLRKVFLGGFWTNVLNPKVAIFFLAFVPQFIAPGTDNKALAFVLLGVAYASTIGGLGTLIGTRTWGGEIWLSAQRWLVDSKATLHELAAQYQVSAERIRQLEQNAMKKLKLALLEA